MPIIEKGIAHRENVIGKRISTKPLSVSTTDTWMIHVRLQEWFAELQIACAVCFWCMWVAGLHLSLLELVHSNYMGYRPAHDWQQYQHMALVRTSIKTLYSFRDIAIFIELREKRNIRLFKWNLGFLDI